MKQLNIVVIGGGMYVSGRGTSGFGTVLPALSEWVRESKKSGDIYCVTTSPQSASLVNDKAKQLALKTGVDLGLIVYPSNEQSAEVGYLDLIRKIPKPACAIIVVPDHLHYAVAKDCLTNGLHVLLVKPMTPTTSEGLDLIDIAAGAKLYGAVEFHKRWDKSNLLLRDQFRSGALGAPLSCVVEYSQRKSVPMEFFRSWAEDTNILQYLGIHYIDIVRFVTNAYPQRVMATGQKSFLSQHGVDTFDAIQCTVEWQLQSGERFTQTLITNWIDPKCSSAHSDQKIKIIGTKGRYEADQKDRGITVVTDQGGIEHLNPDFCMSFETTEGNLSWRGYGIDSFTTFLQDVVDYEEGRTSLCTLNSTRSSFREGLISTAVIEAANKSLANNSDWISVPEA